MKQKFLLSAIAIILSTCMMAQNINVSKQVDGPAFDELNISGPVTVELIESENNSVLTSGSNDFVNGVNITWLKKTLHISYSRSGSEQNNTIKVFAKNVKYIVAEEGAKIVTPKPLNVDNLKITIRDDSQAKLMNYGKIRVDHLENAQVSKYVYPIVP